MYTSTTSMCRPSLPDRRLTRQVAGAVLPSVSAFSKVQDSIAVATSAGWKPASSGCCCPSAIQISSRRHNTQKHPICTRAQRQQLSAGGDSRSGQEYGMYSAVDRPWDVDNGVKQLTTHIKEAARPEELLRLVQRFGREFNHIHVKAAMIQLSKWQKKEKSMMAANQQVVRELLGGVDQILSSGCLQKCSMEDLRCIIFCCSLLGHTNTQLFSRTLQQFLNELALVTSFRDLSGVVYALGISGQRINKDQLLRLLEVAADPLILDNAAPDEVSGLLVGLANMKQKIPDELLQQYLSHMISKSTVIQPKTASTALWAVASMGQNMSQQHVQQLVARLLSNRREVKAKDISRCLWAVAILQQHISQRSVHQLLACLMDKVPELRSHEASNCLWAVASMGRFMSQQQTQQLVAQMVNQSTDLKPNSVSTCLWAVATMKRSMTHQQVQQMMAFMIKDLAAVQPHAVCNCLWAVASMGQSLSEQQSQQLVTYVVGDLASLRPRHLSNVLWAAATMKQQLTSQQVQQLVTCLLERSAELQPVYVSKTLWALAAMKQQITEQQLQQLISSLVSNLDDVQPQTISNSLWAVVKMNQKVPEQQVQQLVEFLVSNLDDVQPQAISNSLWAVVRMNQEIPEQQVQQLVTGLISKLDAANVQEVSNTLWAVAAMNQQIPEQQVQQLVEFLVSRSADLTPHDVSDSLWAVAKMQEFQPRLRLGHLLHLEAVFSSRLEHAEAWQVAKFLRACGSLRYFPQHLLAVLDHQQLWESLLSAMNPYNLAQVGLALASLGQKSPELMAAVIQQALGQQSLADTDSNRGNPEQFAGWFVCSLCWSVAMLDFQQHIPDVLVLLQSCAKQFDMLPPESLRQIQQVHLWLQDKHRSTPAPAVTGLGGIFTTAELNACQDVWEADLQQVLQQVPSKFEQDVLATLQQLTMRWQVQPAARQLAEPDGMFSIDISGVTADGVRLAIEADGPNHGRRPDYQPTGATLYKRLALATRGYVVISVPGYEWQKLQEPEDKQQYLASLLQQQLPSADESAGAAVA